MTEENNFQYWAALAVFSLVNLTSLTSVFEEQSHKDWSREQRWVVSVAIISMTLSAISCFLHLGYKKVFAGTFVELGMIVVVLGLWCAGLPTLMGNEQFFAVAEMGISNGNIYFSGWGSFIMAVVLATSHFRKYFDRQEDKTLFHWIGFTTSSLVVMTSTSIYWHDNCESLDDGADCKRTMLGIVLGAISGFIGFSLIWLSFKAVEQVMSVLLLTSWCFAAAYITFDQGPGKAVGTLYFGTWLSLLFALQVAAESVQEWIGYAMTSATTEESEPAEAPESAKELEGDPKAADSEDKEEEEVEAEAAV